MNKLSTLRLVTLGALSLFLGACGDAPTTSTGAASTTSGTGTGTTTSAASGTAAATAATATITLSSVSFGVSPLSANGTTSVSVSVYANGTLITSPTSVSFESVCGASGKAQLAATATTSSGVATVSYLDKGCSGIDTVTVKVGTVTASGDLTVLPPEAGSIQFVSAIPQNITLKGTGGAGLQETSRVQFKVVDAAGNPISGASLSFSLSTGIGGITLVSSTGVSDADGFAFADVNAGSVSTPVRVTASIAAAAATIATQSDLLVISTGIPDQASLSVTATKHNIEGWNYDGEVTTINARLADHFNNPVPDGTAVSFTTEGGQIISSCTTTAGACSVNLTSQNIRPNDGRVTVLVYAVGEETFIDLNGDGYVNSAAELFDINAVATDLGEAFRDDNENGTRQVTETFLDFNSDSVFNGPDTLYNGVLCKQGVAAQCPAGTPQSLHIFANHTILFSGSFALTATALPASVNLDAVAGPVGTGCGGAQTFPFLIADINNNEMPIGTTVTVSTDNGTLLGETAFTIADSTSLYTPGVSTNFSFSIKGDGTYDPLAAPATCSDTTTSGVLTIVVATPKGNKTQFTIPVAN